ncbi:MAG: mycothiol synthase [Leifsonia sp.]
MSLVLNSLDLMDDASAAALRAVAESATRFDGYHPFNEQSMLDAAAGRRRAVLIVGEGAAGTAEAAGALDAAGTVGAAILGQGELDLVILPEHRRHGFGAEAVETLLRETDSTTDLTAWAHGDHPAARALADRFGFAPVRTLLQLRMPLGDDGSDVTAFVAAVPAADAAVAISAFRPGVDDAEWVALNALTFASHPEQGAVTLDDLADRQAEPWFEAGDFLLAREARSDDSSDTARLVGYNWLKIEEPDGDGSRLGEVYVIGVHQDAAGRGLGRLLMEAGLRRLRERGCTTAALYVEADNHSAVHLYRSLGFIDHTIDVQYRRGAVREQR